VRKSEYKHRRRRCRRLDRVRAEECGLAAVANSATMALTGRRRTTAGIGAWANVVMGVTIRLSRARKKTKKKRNREVLIRVGDGLDHEHCRGGNTGHPEMSGGELQNLLWLAREGERRGGDTSNVVMLVTSPTMLLNSHRGGDDSSMDRR